MLIEIAGDPKFPDSKHRDSHAIYQSAACITSGGIGIVGKLSGYTYCRNFTSKRFTIKNGLISKTGAFSNNITADVIVKELYSTDNLLLNGVFCFKIGQGVAEL